MRILSSSSSARVAIGRTYASQSAGSRRRVGVGPERISASVQVQISREARERYEALELERFVRDHKARREQLKQDIQEQRPDVVDEPNAAPWASPVALEAPPAPLQAKDEAAREHSAA